MKCKIHFKKKKQDKEIETMTKRRERQKEEERKRKGGLHQLFERGMHKRSHSSLHCCGLPYVQLCLFSLCKIGNITQYASGATDHIQTYAIH